MMAAQLFGDEEEEADDVLGRPLRSARGAPGPASRRPTGHVLRWHFRIITQPLATSGAVAKPNSSAPEQRGERHVAPGLELPVDLEAHPLAQPVQRRAPGASRRGPSSHGVPACWIDESGDAPVPPSCPAMWIESACAFATPAAIVPTPASLTSFTLTRARELTHFRSKMSCARSSME